MVSDSHLALVAAIDPAWSELLQTCPREAADRATDIRRTLKRQIGKWQAGALLSCYREAILRVASGGCQRLFVDSAGETMRLATVGE
jgi:hypothetical protein